MFLRKKRVLSKKKLYILKKISLRNKTAEQEETTRKKILEILSWCKLEQIHCLQWSCASLSNAYALAQCALLIKSLNCYLQSLPYHAVKFVLLLATFSFKKRSLHTQIIHTALFFLCQFTKKVFQVVITLHLVSERVILKGEHCFTNWTHTLFIFL